MSFDLNFKKQTHNNSPSMLPPNAYNTNAPIPNEELYMTQISMHQISPQQSTSQSTPQTSQSKINQSNNIINPSSYVPNYPYTQSPSQQPNPAMNSTPQQGFADVNYSNNYILNQPSIPSNSISPKNQLYSHYYPIANELMSPVQNPQISQHMTNSPNFNSASIYDILNAPQKYNITGAVTHLNNNNNNPNQPLLKRFKTDDSGGYSIPYSHNPQPATSPNSNPNSLPVNPNSPYSISPNPSSPFATNVPSNHIALNKECALHLAKRAANDLNVLIKFVSALEGDYIPNQNQLFSAKQAISKFTESLQASQSPTFRDDPPQTDLTNTLLEDYTLLDTLGTGTFGRVRLCKYNVTSDYFCVKILSKEKVVRLKQQEHVKSEKSILLQCKHPFIVKLYTTFQDEKNLYFIMEYISGGELFTVIKKTGGLQTNIARIYAAEIILVIEYLHQRNIIHRDLKPENVLIDKLGHLKLTDFGFAKHINNDKTWTMCGTPEYIAPEIILSKGHGKCVDWWSLGVLLYEMLAGHPPFQGDNNYSVFQNILSGEVKIPPHFDRDAADLITKLLSLDITQRLGCMKGGASEVKGHQFFAGVEWEALYHKRCWGPIHPKVGFANDTSNFLNDEADSELSSAFTGDQNIFKEF